MSTDQTRPRGFGTWRRHRPFVGALMIAIAGVEMFFSTQLDIGNLHVQLGIEGFQATVIPLGFVLLSVLIVLMPQHRIFYGVLALAFSLYSIVGVNLGGFIIGMLLSAVGGILAVSWAPDSMTERIPAADASDAARVTEPALISVSSGSPHGELNAEFVSYSELVALANVSRSGDVPS